MKVLVIGGGGREHTVGWRLSKSDKISKLYFAPGNGGTSVLGENVNLSALDDMLAFAKRENIDFTVVGPEQPLVDGVVDLFEDEGLKIFGPSKAAALLEGSKAFSKEVMASANVPTASFEILDDFRAARRYVESHGEHLVVKASGLAAGKGVIVCQSRKEALNALESIMGKKRFGEAGNTVVIEELLVGEEVSVLALVSGEKILPFLPSQDHKRAYDNDEGPNTGGMGAYAPTPFLTESEMPKIIERVFKPTIKELMRKGIEYKGVLYGGIIMTKDGPKVLEFNVRFGDPETQVILPLLEDDLLEVLIKANDYTLGDKLNCSQNSALAVVMASKGYPGSYEKGFEINIPDLDCNVFHAGTKAEEGRFYTSGGRVLACVGVSNDLISAKEKTYRCVERIECSNLFYRKDIGDKGIKYLSR
ncbi:phosphoribosylamine--glycine ligase [candidate division WOR-3 bacterium]|nr:phosphoribosylamine--glycine ligase [candidate division WOR-3 bacterium]